MGIRDPLIKGNRYNILARIDEIWKNISRDEMLVRLVIKSRDETCLVYEF